MALLTFIAPAVHARTVHVKPGGDNAAVGDAEHPLGMLHYAVQLIKDSTEPGEIIIHAGRYHERVDLQNPKLPEGQAIPPLVIRAADGEEVILDGSRPLTSAKPAAGYPNVYTFAGDYPGGLPPEVWEPAARLRYTAVADLQAVAAMPGSVTWIDKQTAAVHTSNGRHPGEVGALASYHLFAIFSYRDNLTIRGLHFENHLGWSWSAGCVIQGGTDVTIEDCSSINAIRGFIASSKAVNTRFIRCRVDDVGGGVYSGATNVTIEDCVLAKIRDRFMIDIVAQDDSGIQYYSPARQGTIRGNVIRGFRNGIFLKSSGGAYTVEHNTVVDAVSSTFNNTWLWDDKSPTVIRRNIFADSRLALLYPPDKPLPPGATFSENLCWGGPHATQMQGNVDEIGHGAVGNDNIVADPLFVDPDKGDYRVRPHSPAVSLAKGQTPWGAAATTPLPPPTPGIPAVVPEPIVIAPSDVLPATPRILHVAHGGADQSDHGDAAHPFATLGYALNCAGPGDTVRLAPGFYVAGAIVINRSGAPGRPITIDAEKPDTVTLDAMRRVQSIFTIEKASHIVIRNLNLRWAKQTVIAITDSSDITIEGCRFRNQFWAPQFVDHQAVNVHQSPRCTIRGCIAARVGLAFRFLRSPQAVVENNSATAMDYGGLCLIESCRDSRVVNNSFCFAGNDSVSIYESNADAFRSLVMDYNNLAAAVFRKPNQPMKVPFAYMDESKAVVLVDVKGYESPVELHAESRLHTLAEWQAYSGKDQHSLFADPKWIDPASDRWELAADSPNLRAGENGVTIGATEAAP